MPISAETRARRHAAIRSLLRRRKVHSQSELGEALARAGHEVDQSTLCRDLRDLGIAKIDGTYRVAATLGTATPGTGGGEGAEPEGGSPGPGAIARFLAGAHPAGPHLLVVRCAIGTASAVGLAIDAEAWPEVVGTLAGDDTLFVATASVRGQRAVIARLEEIERLGSRGRDGTAARAAGGTGG